MDIVRQKSFYSVVTDEGEYEISGELLRQYHLEEAETADSTLLESLHRKSRFRRAYQRAGYLLDERDYSYSMMYQKLMQTYRDRELCTAVLRRLVENGYIDDRRYAAKCAEYLVERKKYGIYRARQDMLHRGLEKNLVEAALQPFQETAAEQIPAVLEKKYGRILTDPDDRKARERAIAGMVRLGYDFRSVRNAIEDYFADWEDEDEET